MPVFQLRSGRAARAWVSTSVVVTGALGLAACSEPSREAEPPRIETSWTGGSVEPLPRNLMLEIRNRGSAAICLPRNHTEEMLLIYQAGRQVHWNMGNSGTLIWRGLDVVTGVIVVPPGEESEVYYTLDDWPLKAGPAEARINLMTVNCAELFTSATPRITRKVTTYRFVAPAPAATSDALER
jgi:hypothetical protein